MSLDSALLGFVEQLEFERAEAGGEMVRHSPTS
jgi:hypothetical protein